MMCQHKASLVKTNPSWSTRERIAEDIDDEHDFIDSEDRILSSINRTESLIRQIHYTAKSCPRQHDLTTKNANRKLRVEQRAEFKALKGSNKACRVPPTTAAAEFFSSKQISPSLLSSKWTVPSESNDVDRCLYNEATHSNFDGWIDHTAAYQGLVSGQHVVHNGQAGVWHFVPNVDSVRREWRFVPDKPPAINNPKHRSNKRRPKDKTDFLSLPGEIRNVVYGYVIPECRILIVQNKPNKELDTHKKIWSEEGTKHRRPRSRLSHILDSGQINEGLGITMHLLLACKRIRDDVELYLYSRTTFCFTSANVLTRFLNTASKPGLRTVRKVEILHNGYANPQLTCHQTYRDKYYNRWSKTCAQIGKEMIELEHLKLEAHLREWPCDLSAQPPANSWWKSCLQIAPRRLAKVEAKLHHSMIHRNEIVLKELARRLEDEMMTLEGRNERDLMETLQVLNDLEAKKAAKEARAKARLARKNAPTELVISQEDLQDQNPVPSKVCKRGLEKYFRVNTAEMSLGELQCFKSQYCSRRHKA